MLDSREGQGMSGSNDEVTNSAGPASSTEPSMEEILASIRRILKDEQTGAPSEPAAEIEEEEILVLDSSMAIRPPPSVDDFGGPPVLEDTELHPALPGYDPPPEYREPEDLEPKDLEPKDLEPQDLEPKVLEPEELAPQELAPQDLEPQELAPPEAEPPHLTSEAFVQDNGAEDSSFDLPLLDEPDAGTSSFAKENDMSDDSEQMFQPPHGLVGEAASAAAASSIGSLIRSISTECSIAIGRPGLTLEDLVREELRPLLKSWLDSNLPALVERIVRAEIQRVVERSNI
jgi:cell pole-organizing protein PopZ